MALREGVLVAQHELRRNLRSKKGIAMFILFVLGGAVPSIVQILLDDAARAAHMSSLRPEEEREMVEQGLLLLYKGDHAVAHYLASCPPVLLFVFKGTMFFLPLLTLLVGFDQISGEVQHRAIRYLVGRAERHAIVVGKAIGVYGVIATMVLVLHVVVWIALVARSEFGLGVTLSWGLRLWAFSAAFAAAYVGLVSAVSAWFKTPVLALFVGAGVAFGLLVVRGILLAIGEKAEAATWLFPSTYESLMVSPNPLTALGGCALSIGWGALAVGLATLIVRRRDL